MEYGSVKDNLKRVQERIKRAAVSCGRDPETVRLAAVSKTMSAEAVKAAAEAGGAIFGENYIQEAKEKISELSSCSVSWHFIGHLQSNKAKYAVKLFDLIHSVDSLKLARELDKQAGKEDKVQDILIQVNISMEETKSGVTEEETLGLVRELSLCENLSIRGLMTMPPYYNEPEKVRPYFSALRELRDSIKKENINNVFMDELSMGMTGDFETAIEEGATLVRVGTAVFGGRN